MFKTLSFKKNGLVTGAVLLCALTAGCATSPTGRPQLSLMSDSQMANLGASAYSDMKKKTPISADAAQTRYVQCIARAITNELDDNQQWEVTLFDDDQVNAFALPGGKIGVYTGLLKVAENQHQLAAVMGHEVAHVLANHSKARLSANMAAQTGMLLGTIAIGASSSGKKQGMMAALGLGVQFGVLMPYGRAQESESDILGVDLMAKAGFDPRASTDLWRNMAAANGTKVPELLSTHPAPATRISDLERRLPQAIALQNAALSQGKRPACG